MFTSKIICCAFIHRLEKMTSKEGIWVSLETMGWATQTAHSTGQNRQVTVEGWGGGSKIKMLASKVKVLELGFPESVKIMSGDHGG